MQQPLLMPVRTIPVDCSFEGANAVRTFARIYVHPAGQSLGNSRVGSRVVPSGSFASSKAGVAIPWVRHRERALVHVLECHPDVMDYRTYPHCLEVVVGGRRIRYIPDAAYQWTDGTVQVVSFVEPPKRTVEVVTAIYGRLEWVFRILAPTDYDHRSKKARFLNRLLTYRNAKFSAAETFTVQTALSAGNGTARLEDLVTRLGGHPSGFAKICAMHFARELVIDFDRRGGPDMWVSSPTPRTAPRTLNFKLWEKCDD
jgi:hypothetical protein